MNKKGEILKQIKGKLEKASRAHAGQAKAIGKILSPQKKMLGGLLTKGIKEAYKGYRKSGGKKVADRVRDEMKALTKPAPRSQQLKEDPGGRIRAFKFPVKDYKRLYGESEYSVKARKPSLRTLNKSDVKGRMKEDLKSKLRATKDKATRRKLIRDINKLK